VGATPVFADVRAETFNLDPTSLTAAISVARESGLTPRAVIPVDLFGQPADYGAIAEVAEGADLWVLADAAQSFGGSLGPERAGALGDVGATSFFPAKPLGCYGDGGAIFTDDSDLAALLRSLRVHGSGETKYDTARVGLNSRLDTLQAAILLQKLAIFDDEMKRRQVVAERYRTGLGNSVATPRVKEPLVSAWAQYTIRSERRDDIAAHLRAQGIPTAIYYPKPLHQQTAYRGYPIAPGGAPVSEELSRTVLSLPMHPYLEESVQDRIVAAVREALA
jgi:dTDP-4-amino-4,6-dideoxygalactose transaminase